MRQEVHWYKLPWNLILHWTEGKFVQMKKSDDDYHFPEEESKRIWKAKTFVDVGFCYWIENMTDNRKLPWYGEKRICTLEVKNCNSTKGSAKILIFIPIKILWWLRLLQS